MNYTFNETDFALKYFSVQQLDTSNLVILVMCCVGMCVTLSLGVLTTYGVLKHNKFRWRFSTLNPRKNGSKGLTLLLCQWGTTWSAFLLYVSALDICVLYKDEPPTENEINRCITFTRVGAAAYTMSNWFTYLFLSARMHYYFASVQQMLDDRMKHLLRLAIRLLFVFTLFVPCICAIVSIGYTGNWRSSPRRIACNIYDTSPYKWLSIALLVSDSTLSFGYWGVFLIFLRVAIKKVLGTSNVRDSTNFKRTAYLNLAVTTATVLITFFTMVMMTVANTYFAFDPKYMLAGYWVSGLVPLDCLTKCLMPFAISNVWLPPALRIIVLKIFGSNSRNQVASTSMAKRSNHR